MDTPLPEFQVFARPRGKLENAGKVGDLDI
jgi:hypothetical protein